MKSFIVACLLAVAPFAALAEFYESPSDKAVVWRTNIVNGSLVLTNDASDIEAWSWAFIEYTVDQNWTNAFTLSLVRSYDVDFQYQTNDVRTNVFGDVETNVSWTVTNTIERITTNIIFTATTTNAHKHLWACEASKLDGHPDPNANRLPRWVSVLPGDRIVATMTATNSIPFGIGGMR